MLKRLFHIILSVVIMSSCMNDKMKDTNTDELSIMIRGTVTDHEGKAIEHIRITITSDISSRNTCYSSSDGRYQCFVPVQEIQGNLSFEICLEDIDGKENGGEFNSISDKVTIFENELYKLPIIIDLNTFRLTPSTALESNLQSGQTADGN